MDFGEALNALKGGNRVARAGWNGKGMWLALIRGRHVQIHHNGFGPINEHDHEWRDRVPRLLDWIGMKTADNGFVPWLASQTDMLAEDWTIVLDINRDPLPGWKNNPFPPPPEEPPPINVDGTITAAVNRLLSLAETGNMGRMPEKPLDLLVKVCRAHLTERGAEIPQDLRDRCNDALLAALTGGR